MGDNEDWRRRKAEELGLVDTGPWLAGRSRPLRPATPTAGAVLPRAPAAAAAPAPARGNAAAPAPEATRSSTIPGDGAGIDRRPRLRPEVPQASPAAAPAAAPPGLAGRRGRARVMTMLAIVTGLAFALVLGWWLRGAATPVQGSLAAPPPPAPSSGTAPDAQPGTMAIPEPAPARSPSVIPLAPVEDPPATLPAASPPPRAEGSPSARQYRDGRRVRMPATHRDDAVSRLDRPGEPGTSPSARRGRFTAPRAVAASGRDFRPSFDCRRATSWVNRLVCNDRELAALDVRMSDAYGRAIAAAGPAGERRIDADQARFLAQRMRCRSAACVDQVYRIRVDELDFPS